MKLTQEEKRRRNYDRERKSFLIYESYYWNCKYIEAKADLTKEEKEFCRRARAHCRRFEKRRARQLAEQSRISAIRARAALTKFYKTHNPPYSNADRCFIIANTLSFKEGRRSLAKAMLEPIKRSL